MKKRKTLFPLMRPLTRREKIAKAFEKLMCGAWRN